MNNVRVFDLTSNQIVSDLDISNQRDIYGGDTPMNSQASTIVEPGTHGAISITINGENDFTLKAASPEWLFVGEQLNQLNQ